MPSINGNKKMPPKKLAKKQKQKQCLNRIKPKSTMSMKIHQQVKMKRKFQKKKVPEAIKN